MMITEIADKMTAAWKSSEEIREFCETTFSARPVIQIGTDNVNPPSVADFPLICITEMYTDGGHSGKLQHHFLIGVAILEETVLYDPDERVRTYLGISHVDQLRTLAENAVFAAKLGKVTWEGSVIPPDEHPIYISMSGITIETVNPKVRRN